MVQCKDCKFAYEYIGGLLACGHDKLQDNSTPPEINDDYASYCFYECGCINVGGNFGCIHGEKK